MADYLEIAAKAVALSAGSEFASVEAERFKSRDAASYDSVTEAFERFTDRLTAPLARRTVALARLSPAERILDVGTGTGVVALEAARRIAPGGKILGIDLSEGMLATAKIKAARARLADRVEFRRMDAEALQLEDQSCDVVLSLFALLHIPNPRAALTEMFRVLRPGGRLVLAVGSGPALFSLSGLIHRAGRLLELMLVRQGKQLTGPGFLNHMVERRLPLPDVSEESALAGEHANRAGSVPPLVRQAGFIKVRTDWEGHQAVVQTPEEFWDMQQTFSSIARKRLAAATPEQVEHLREEFLSECRQAQARGGRLVYPFAAFYVIAERPRSKRRVAPDRVS